MAAKKDHGGARAPAASWTPPDRTRELTPEEAAERDRVAHLPASHRPCNNPAVLYLVVKRDGSVRGFCGPNAKGDAEGQSMDDLSSCVLKVTGTELLHGEEPFAFTTRPTPPEQDKRRRLVDPEVDGPAE